MSEYSRLLFSRNAHHLCVRDMAIRIIEGRYPRNIPIELKVIYKIW